MEIVSDLSRLPSSRFNASTSLSQRLVHLPLIEEPFLGLKLTRENHANLFPICPIYTEDPCARCRHPKVEKPGLHRKPRRIRQQPHRKWVLKGLFYFPLRQRTLIEGRIIPIKLHNGLIVNSLPMQCLYFVFTHRP